MRRSWWLGVGEAGGARLGDKSAWPGAYWQPHLEVLCVLAAGPQQPAFSPGVQHTACFCDEQQAAAGCGLAAGCETEPGSSGAIGRVG
jgi:hypothetical protein